MGIVKACRERAREIESIDLRIEILRITKLATDEELKAMLEAYRAKQSQPTYPQVIATGQYDRT